MLAFASYTDTSFGIPSGNNKEKTCSFNRCQWWLTTIVSLVSGNRSPLMGMNPDTEAAHNRVEKYQLPSRVVPKLQVCKFILIPKNNKETGYCKIPQPRTPWELPAKGFSSSKVMGILSKFPKLNNITQKLRNLNHMESAFKSANLHFNRLL